MQEYYNLLGNIPEFLNKYLELDIIKRLKGISLLCGMDYASKNAYDFREYISRFDHSLDVALITWNLTHDKCATLAGLFHDISTPVFSHVVDYMNGDYINQESTEKLTEMVMINNKELLECLKIDNIDIKHIIDFKKYSVVDLDRPKMCADRLDNIILVSYNWTKTLNENNIKTILNSLYLEKNEDGEDEIAFNNKRIALYIKKLNDQINVLTHSNIDNYMMDLASKIIKYTIDINLVTYNELFEMTEMEYINIIENNLNDKKLYDMWYLFKNIDKFPIKEMPPIRNKIVNPLTKTKRI